MKQTRKILSLATAFAMAVSMAVFTPSAMAEKVDLSKDSVQPELAENLMKTSVKEGDNLTAARNFNGKPVRINAEVDFNVDSDQSHWGASQTWSSSILEALQEIGNPMLYGHEYYGTTGIYVSLNSGAFQPNKTYVFRAYVKSDGTEDAYYTNGIESGIYDTLVYSNEYGKTGKKIESGDYSEYATTITLPASFDVNGNNWFISILPDGTKKGAKIRFRTENADDVYLAEEQAYTLDVSSPYKKISAGESVELSAEVLNQIGLKGGLDQNVTWHAMNADRTAEVEGFTFSGNKVTVADSVAAGKYMLVAESAYGLVKGFEVEVVKAVSYKDTVQPEMNENMIPKSSDEFNSRPRWFRSAIGRNGDGRIDYITDEGVWDSQVLGASKSTSIYVCAGQTTNPSAITGYDGIILKNTLKFESGKSYCVSLRAKLADKSLHADKYPAAENTGAAIGVAITNETYGSTSYTKEYGNGAMTLDSGYKEFKGTIPVSDKYDNNGNQLLVIGYPKGYTEGSAISIDTSENDAIYIAPEQAYTLDVNAEKTNLSIGETTNVSANVLNQVGLEGTLSQNVSWLALDTDRIEKVSGISIVPNENGAAVTVGADVPEGSYDIVALSEEYGMVKGVTITVSDTAEKISALTLSQEGGYVNLAASVANCTSDKVVFALAAYNGGKLADLIVEEKTVANGEANVDMMFEEPLANGTVVKAFMLAGAATMKPIANINGFNTTMTINSAE